MDISVIIVNYNVREFLRNALVSISKALESFEGEVCVVDNASDDGSCEMVRSAFPSVHLIENRTNTGFARANNQALALAKGSFVVLINPDTVVQEDTFTALVSFFNANPDVGMAGCKILNPDGTLQLACRRSFPTPWVALTKTVGLSHLFPSSRLFARYNMTYLDPNENYEVDAISGSFMMLRRSVYEKIGGLDEQFFMYGEDLDWCYRVQRGGWKVFYVPQTQIIHYKGESTKRSDVDELRLFYQAMRLFVRKHYRRSMLFSGLIEVGIVARSIVAAVTRALRPLLVAFVDAIIVCGAILLAAYLYRGRLFFPAYAYPWAFVVPSLVVVVALFLGGLYTNRRLSLSRSLAGVIGGFVLIAAITAFLKDYAFSRATVLISGLFCSILVPGWRLAVRLRGGGAMRTRKSIFGRRTLIVGVDGQGQELLRKLRNRPAEGYEVIGFVDLNRQRLGQRIMDVDILGSVDTIGKVIDDHRISEVIFSTDAVSYTTILSIIGRARSRTVNFRLVPTTMEVIIGKASIDQLDEIPLIEIDYGIHRFTNRLIKRAADIVVSSVFLISVVPFVYCIRLFSHKPPSPVNAAFLRLPRVLNGSMSLVGREGGIDGSAKGEQVYLGKPGLTGLVQIHSDKSLTAAERIQYELYYAKNQSLLLDLEIGAKALMRFLRHSG